MRKTLSELSVHPAVKSQVGGSPDYQSTVNEVIAAVESNDVVVVGMNQNPFPKKARKLLDKAGVNYIYLEYGSYFKEWKRRGAIKMWSGWQTFPMIFIKGALIGGFSDLEKLQASGELQQMLS